MRISKSTTTKMLYLSNVDFLKFEVVENVGHGLQSDEFASTIKPVPTLMGMGTVRIYPWVTQPGTNKF
jgi:hypothetical protein